MMHKALLFVLALFGAPLCLAADVYPNKAVRVVVPFGPGGGSDTVARIISQQLSEQLGQTFVVDNRTGAGGTIGAGVVARAAPDGYTLLLADTSTAMAPGLYRLQFDVARDFAPVTYILRSPSALLVHPSLNVNTLKEFIALAHANPGKFNYGSTGLGSTNHLNSELFRSAAKVNLAHIPYKGGAEAAAALLGGQIQMLIGPFLTLLPHVNSGKVRALAVLTDGKRAPALPDVPSMSEAGISGMAVYSWFGLVGPAGMPTEVVNKLRAEVVKALAVPSVRDRYVAQGAELLGSTPEEFSVHIRSELKRWAEVIKSVGIKAE